MKTVNVLYVEPCLITPIIFYFLLLLSIPISFIMVLRTITYKGVAIELFTPPLRDQCEGGPHNLATLIAPLIAHERTIIKLRGYHFFCEQQTQQ